MRLSIGFCKERKLSVTVGTGSTLIKCDVIGVLQPTVPFFLINARALHGRAWTPLS